MNKPLKALIVEDSPNDAELLIHALSSGGYDVTHERVETADAMRAAIERGGWDIILSDYSLPTFSGPDALAVSQAMDCDAPFIIVSGTIGEETAVSALKAGAQDFLVKGRLARLIPAVERELREAAAHRERKQLEEQLHHAQKMEAVGQLAGSVAHDFNNVLTAILGFCELAITGLPVGTPEVTDLMEIQKAGERAVGLTRQLLAFSRRQVLQPKLHDVNALVSSVEPMLRRLIVENIELSVTLDPDISLIKIDATQLEQILINLVVNASDAMSYGGKLSIAVTPAVFEPGAQELVGDPADYIMLSVKDTGTGMDLATQRRMFEPFFTTKGVGKGTGLGLSTVHRIVTQSGGQIAITSEPGCGTTFRIYFPRAFREVSGAMEVVTPVGENATGTETVLLAEDDPAVRRLARMCLRRAGYRVLEAGNPHEAVQIAKDFTPPIHLLLSDVIMPESEGAPLVDRLRTARPDMRVLYMSGYTDDTIVHHGVLDEGTHFLQKPFTPVGLTQKVREVLDQKVN